MYFKGRRRNITGNFVRNAVVDLKRSGGKWSIAKPATLAAYAH
jgi:hypothetical protein